MSDLNVKKLRKKDIDFIQGMMPLIKENTVYASYHHKIATIANIMFDERDENLKNFFIATLYVLIEYIDVDLSITAIQNYIHKYAVLEHIDEFKELDMQSELSEQAKIYIKRFLELDIQEQKIVHMEFMLYLKQFL